MIALAAVCALACAVLVWAEARGRRGVRAIAKPVASLAFVALGVIAGGGAQPWMLAGLGLGALGDVALLGDGKHAFLAGLGAFLLGHVAYVVAIAVRVPPDTWLPAAGWRAAVPVAVGIGALAWLWPHLGKLRVPVIAYVAAIVAMMVGALAVADAPRLTAGAALFFASDLAVARDRFVAHGFANKAWGLPAYYAGQLLIAWSLAG